LLGSLAFVGVAQAAVSGNGQAEAVSRSVSSSRLPSWYHAPLSAAALRHEVAVPKDPEQVTGAVRLTHADYRDGAGELGAGVRQAIGKTLIAGESLQLPGGTLFRLSSDLPVVAARQELAELKSALTYVTGVTCEGYTDYGPHSAVRDITLGKDRALKVCDLIRAVNPKITTTAVSYGSTRPAVVGGTTHAERSLNRRVVIDITASSVGVPRAPRITLATAGDGTITLDITPQPSAMPVTHYQYSLDGGKTWINLALNGSSRGTGTITGLTNGHVYTVIVRDRDAAGTSLDSHRATVTPALTPTPTPTPAPAPTSTVPSAPSLNAVTAGNAQATVVFAAPASNSTDQPTGYEVSTDGGATWTPVTTSGSSPYTITVTGLTNGTTYTVKVRAVDGTGDSSPSNSLQVTPAAPTAPAAPTITNGSYSSPTYEFIVTLSWTAGSDGGSPVTAWQYSQGGGPYTTLANVTETSGTYQATFDSGTNSCVFDGDEPYTMKATNSVGTSVASNVYVIDLEGFC
jgi:outer membrane protein OmpA-like peptidoglycan-associated protein